MRGIAVVEEAAEMAVWIVSRNGAKASNVNAVVIDYDDPRLAERFRSLTRCCAVFVTRGSTLDGLPIEGEPLTMDDVVALVRETEEYQWRILDAITEHNRRTGASLITPSLPDLPSLDDFIPGDGAAGQGALAAANFISRAWTAWLKTDEERRRRTVQPQTGATPWVMPDDMNAPTVPDFPEGFAARLYEQPLV